VVRQDHTFRSSSIYGQRVVVGGRLRDLRGHGVQGARIDVYHLRRTGKHRRLVKTGLETCAHGDLTLILPLNVDTGRIEFAYRTLRPGPITSRRMPHLTVMRHGTAFARTRT
jgi:protocatechuate 3,4-dioxygenase beta subunit